MMTKTKHPKDRAERLRLREKKERKKEPGAGKVRRQVKSAIREKEAEDEISSEISNS